MINKMMELYDIKFDSIEDACYAGVIEANNILNNKFQRWYLYQQLGINGKIGILAKF